jgi:hypothetical protein
VKYIICGFFTIIKTMLLVHLVGKLKVYLFYLLYGNERKRKLYDV